MIVLIHDLRRQGLSISAISRKTGLDRRTVRKYLDRSLEAPAYSPRRPRPRLIEGHEDWIRRKAAACPGISARRLLRGIRKRGYRGGYSRLTEFLRGIRDELPRSFETRFETPPGKQAQVLIPT